MLVLLKLVLCMALPWLALSQEELISPWLSPLDELITQQSEKCSQRFPNFNEKVNGGIRQFRSCTDKIADLPDGTQSSDTQIDFLCNYRKEEFKCFSHLKHLMNYCIRGTGHAALLLAETINEEMCSTQNRPYIRSILDSGQCNLDPSVPTCRLNQDMMLSPNICERFKANMACYDAASAFCQNQRAQNVSIPIYQRVGKMLGCL